MISSISTPPHPLRQHFTVTTVNLRSPNPSCINFRPPRVARVNATCVCPPPKLVSSSSSSSLYEILGISMGASAKEIKSAYRKLARTFHPDVAAICRKDSSADEFMKIHAAYSTLSDPDQRADYDRRLFQIHRSSRSYSGISSSSEQLYPRFSGYTRRNWETDQCW